MELLIQNRSRLKIDLKKIKRWVSLILKKPGYQDSEISILFVDDEGIRVLNKNYRGKDRATDVLSFSQLEEVKNSKLQTPNSELLLGDVVISLETAKRQAKERGHSFEKEVFILLTHGIFHLLGYDHEKSRKMAAEMRRMEREIIESEYQRVKVSKP
ncbi:MAG: rRNA maturation RNase YbeY [Nitrospinota bacterium]